MNGIIRRTPGTLGTVFSHPAFGPSLQRFFDDFFESAPAAGDRESVTQASWIPAVDVKETDDALTVFIELPGVKKEDVAIALEDKVLAVTGERRFERLLLREQRAIERHG